jgi:excisionase family DNA binding protein
MMALQGNEALVGDGLRTVDEGCSFLRVSRSTLYGLMENGTLKYVKVGRARRIPYRSLVELASANVVGAEPRTDV